MALSNWDNRLALVLVAAAWLLVGCVGSEFDQTATDAADAGPETSSPEASREAGDGQVAVGNDADAGPAPEEAGTTSSSGSSGSSGTTSSSSGSSSGGSSSSSSSSGGSSSSSSGGPCDGGPAVTHSAGIAGVTWQDCVPLGTHTGPQALKACTAWCAANSAGGCNNCVEGIICNSYNGWSGQTGNNPPTVVSWLWLAPNAGEVTDSPTCGASGTWD
jgi:hypothetical protein